jgi:hypothetical protein
MADVSTYKVGIGHHFLGSVHHRGGHHIGPDVGLSGTIVPKAANLGGLLKALDIQTLLKAGLNIECFWAF